MLKDLKPALTSMRSRRDLILAILLTVSPIFFSLIVLPLHVQAEAGHADVIVVDAKASAHPFPHFWEKMFGSGRAILSLRQDYRDELGAVKKITGFDYVRFHAIFDDEVGVYRRRRPGTRQFITSLTSIRSMTGCWPTVCGRLSS